MSTPVDLIEIRRRTGRVWWQFWRVNDQSQNIRHEIKAAACVTKLWPGKEGSPEWEQAAVKWSGTASQGVCDRLDYEESEIGKEAAAQEEYRQLKDSIDRETEERAKLKEEYPNITDTLSAG